MGTNIGPNTTVVAVGSDTGGVVERALEERGVTTESVRTIDACLERLSNADCVVVGSPSPDGDPVDCCRRIRSHRSDVPVVVFPDDGSEALAGAVVAAGADGYVPRSQGVETLTERLRALLAERRTDGCAGDARPDATDSRAAASTDDHSDRLELLVEQSPLAIVEWSLEFEVQSWNPAATELFGYTADEVIGESIVELLVLDEDRQAVREYRNDLVDGETDGEPFRRVHRTVREDGTTVTCEWFNAPLIEDGEVVSVLSFGQDVTADVKRANALEALQETSQALLRAESTDEIADIVMAATEDVIDQPLAGIRFYDERTETLELAGVTSTLSEHADTVASVGSGESVFWDAYAAQERTIVETVETERIPYDIAAEVGPTIFQPLGRHGLLTVASSGETALDDAEINLIHVLAATAEAALDRAARERELERTRTVVETVGDCVYQLDREGRFVTVNETMMAETGYDRGDLLGEHVSRILTPESVERGARHIRSLTADNEQRVATYEITLIGADGTRTPAEVSMSLLHSDGELVGTVGIARDISDRKRMERKLVSRKGKIEGLHDVASRLDSCESHEEIYEETVEAAEDVLNFDICCVDRARGKELVTQAISSSLEADPDGTLGIDESIAGKTYRTGRSYRTGDVTTDDDASPAVDGIRSVLSVPIGDRGVFQAVSTEPDAFTIADEELAELLLSHVTDALDRIDFEKRLRTERDRFAALFENVPDAVVSVTQLADGPIVEAINPAFERIFGYDEAELVGTPVDETIVPPNRTANAETLNRQGSRGEIGTAEVKRRTADGLRDFRLRVVPIETDGSSDRAFALYTDITAQKQRQKRLEILNRVLRHDLRNGMNIINGCAEILADAVDGSDRQYVETIRNRASELTGLAEKTRSVERVLDRDEIPAGPIDLTTAVEQAVTRLESTHDVDVDCSLPDRAFARADEYLQAALFQVLENAVEHNDRSRPAIDVTLRDRPDDDVLTVTVADDGPGIPEEERELLEGDQEITQLRHASGLGLWLVNWVVTQAGGTLSFVDNEPRGTVVRLDIPRADMESVRSTSDGTAAGD